MGAFYARLRRAMAGDTCGYPRYFRGPPALTTAASNGCTVGSEPDKQESDQSTRPAMALTQRLEIRQSHALVMTPQLMQAIKLLQLSNLDLAAYVEGELERNPLLERTSEGEAPAANGAAAPADAAAGERNDWSGPSAEAG